MGTSQARAEEPVTDVVFGNNLSFPVFWSDGVTKTLRGAPGADPVIGGAWWYQWGVDADGNPLSCPPDPDDEQFCDDRNSGTVGAEPGGRQRAYLQQQENNVWQAETIFPQGPVIIDWIDWGDNLESVPWYLNSKVRIEVVPLKDLPFGAFQYEMLHTYGLGIDEMWGLSSAEGARPEKSLSSQATVYSNCARLTIQRLLVDRSDLRLAQLVWVEPNEDAGISGGWVGDGLINPPIFTGAVRNAGDGPGFYSAEINVKGKVVYGYTWSVKEMNEGAGSYRLTFNLDQEGCEDLNTFIVPGMTSIYYPEEEIITTSSTESSVSLGGVAVVGDNITYLDINILAVKGQGGKKPVAKSSTTKKVIIKKGGKR
ncbi:MAG: hypothetical protein U0944_02535 [Candidatus Moranbacteria bacterium]|nr:hypothetical protein [Candidatus Moranbacteria bacterium]